MMRWRRRARALSLGVLVHLVLGVQGPLALNLCLAADGHASLELAHAGDRCTAEARRHHPGTAALAADESTRHPCRDVPLLERASYRLEAAPEAPSVTVLAMVHPPARESTRIASANRGNAGPAPSTRLLRSVVLHT